MLIKKISFFIGKAGRRVYVERDVTQKGSREQTRQSVMMGVGGSKRQFQCDLIIESPINVNLVV